MLQKTIIHKTKFLLKQNEALLTLILLLWMVLYNYIQNVILFRGTDITHMYMPVKLLLLSYNRTVETADNAILFTMLYPLLVALPAGFSYAKEQQTKEEIFLISRLGKKTYLLSKLGSAFLTTSTVFLLPFLLEFLMTCVSFPLKAQGDFYNVSLYSAEYAGMVHNYPFAALFCHFPVLYTLLGLFVFAVVSGLLGMLTVAISFTVRVRYRALLLLPCFLLLNLTEYVNLLFEADSAGTSWMKYLLLFNESEKFPWYPMTTILFLLLLTALCFHIGTKKEMW